MIIQLMYIFCNKLLYILISKDFSQNFCNKMRIINCGSIYCDVILNQMQSQSKVYSSWT